MTQVCPECGCVLDATPDGKPRSWPQLQRYHVMIAAYYHHWPEWHTLKPLDKEHLRKWLQIKAGWFEIGERIEGLEGIPREQAVIIAEAIIRGAGAYATVMPMGNSLVVVRSKSVSKKSLGHKRACELFDKVQEVAEAETGLKAEQVMRETERAA